MKLASSSFYFSAVPVRDFLTKIEYRTSNPNLQIALSLIFQTNEETLQARKRSYLTNSTSQQYQIRFPLKERIIRLIDRLAFDIKEKFIFDRKFQVNLQTDDFLSIEFFKSFDNIKVDYFVDVPNGEFLTKEENRLKNNIESLNFSISEISSFSQERIYSGDYRTAYKLISSLPVEIRTDSMNYRLGLCCNFFGNFEESEVHFNRLLKSKKPLSFVNASYALSMLYLRMHNKEKQNITVAENLLEKAYALLKINPEIKDHTFHVVFNRNGYALCLFRRGKIQEALDILFHGVQDLTLDQCGSNDLHKSVLIYNSMQCFFALSQYEKCEAMCDVLIKLDPLFPEYFLEQARLYLVQEKFEEAWKSLETAHQIDSFIPEGYALKGYLLLQQGKFVQAAEEYEVAYRLRPSEIQWALDRGHCLCEACDWNNLKILLSHMKAAKMAAEQLEAFEELKLEVVRELRCKIS